MSGGIFLNKNYPKRIAIGLAIVFGVIFSHLYLQWCQNNLSLSLTMHFAFVWHTAKFLLGSLVLLLCYGFFTSLAGSLLAGSAIYGVTVALLGLATYLKMTYRQEPIYPDDLKMVTQLGLLKEMIGTGPFVIALVAILVAVAFFVWQFYRSFRLTKKQQSGRIAGLLISMMGLMYVSHFNQATNLLRRAYNQTALWIPYSQKMNYYNVGFVGGFLYNLRVDAMEKPAGYSKERIADIVAKYHVDQKSDERPNIIYVMSESFSDPSHLAGVQVTGDPLADYYAQAKQTYSGRMLSQNYGGGTANIEFEALTGLSMALLNPQLTTPYTMLVPKLTQLPSLVSLTKARGYQATAIHPYDTSMYKRKDVYNVLGFDRFIDQETITHTEKIENNPYISDTAAYKQVLELLKQAQKPQFIHLVTMQTHMPYQGKYETLNYGVQGEANQLDLRNYLQDVAYSSQALKAFMQQVAQLPQRTLVVFWGDHLPGLYAEATQNRNAGPTLHETEFMMWDSKNKWTYSSNQVMSPFYFAPKLFKLSGLEATPFYEMLTKLEQRLPAFERGMYLYKGHWQKEVTLNADDQQLYKDYQAIQYDLVQGAQYSLSSNFFTN